MDDSGMINVYRYKYQFGVWIIVVSVIGAVFVIAVILGIVIVMRNKRKQHKK
jgi:ABC-type multidrug transport system permease subunit